MMKQTVMAVTEPSIKESSYESLYGSMRSEWRPGDTVDYSGVYNVHHGDDHLMFAGKQWPEQHQVICLAGQVFPACNRCGTRPRFTRIACGKPIADNEYFI
jgi:hypothetical protein